MKSLQLHKPYLLVVVGLPGSGKTFFATKFSQTVGAPYLDYDHYYRIAGNAKIADELANLTLEQFIKLRDVVVIEGRGTTESDRYDLTQWASRHRCNILFIWLQVERSTAESRVVKGPSATMTRDAFQEYVKYFEPLIPAERPLVISGMHTYQSQARTVLRRLLAERPRSSDTLRVGPMTSKLAPVPTERPPQTPGRAPTHRGRVMG